MENITDKGEDIKYGISDLRSFFDSDIKWLNNFGFSIFENIEKI